MRVVASLIVLCSLARFCAASEYSKTSAAHGPANSVQQLVELTPPDGVQDGFFGDAVAISSDGNTIAVGSTNNNGGGGAVYVYQKPASGWQNAILTAELTVPGSFVLGTFAMNSDGSTIVVSPVIINEPYPQVYVFVKPAGGWVNMTPTAALHATHGGPYNFGYSIAADGDNIVVGGLGCSGNGDFSPGAVYLFVKPAAGWTNMTQTARLEETDPIDCDDYGSSVAIQGNTAVVGRTGAGMTPPVAPGALYVFTKAATGWVTMGETAKLTTATQALVNGLGSSVAISGSTILAGAPIIEGTPKSGAYIYTEPANGWVNATQTATLSNTNKGVTSTSAAAAINGSTVALIADYRGGTTRALTLYDEPSGGWQSASTPNLTVIPSDEASGDFFGNRSLSMGGGFIVVGSPLATRNGISAQGVVYIFQQN